MSWGIRAAVALLAVAGTAFVASFLLNSVEHGAPLPAADWSAAVVGKSAQQVLVAEYLTAFNSGNQEQLQACVRATFTPVGPGGSSLDDRLNSQERLYNSSRGFNVLQAQQVSETQVDLVVQFRLTEEWRRMSFMLDQEPQLLISGIRIVPIDPPQVPETATSQPLEAQLERYLTRLVEADQFSGVIIVKNGDKEICARAYGMADQQQTIACTVETPFNYASVGKMFTAVAIGQLVEQGVLGFDDVVADHLPEYAAKPAGQVTVDQLLTHRSGVPDFFELHDEFEQVRASDNPQRDYQQVFFDKPLRFEPGQQFEYSNSNYILLGAMIERISGKPFEQYLDEHVFQAAGMTQTTLDASRLVGIQPAIGYTEVNDQGKVTPGHRRPAERFSTSRGSAAGGGVTTARDMVRFAAALRAGTVLAPERVNELTARQVAGQRPGESYGRGFISRDSKAGRVFGHSGGFPGVDAQVDIYDCGWTVVVLANYEGVGEPVARYVETLIAARTSD